MFTIRLLLLLSILTGCTSPGRTYASKHPELSAEHRQIFVSGKIPNGTAVAGMTHDEVKMAMAGDPDTLDRIDGEEAWVYKRKKLVATEFTGPGDSASNSTSRRTDSLSAIDNTGPQMDVISKTTIFFRGDRATHAEVSEDKP